MVKFILQIRKTVNETLNVNDYDFRIIDSPTELHNMIREKNRARNKARVVAGYCWKWISKRQPVLKDIVIDNYKATWNLDSDGQAWIIKPDSVSEVGCIHTCQGLELDYIGVIVGRDLLARGGKIITEPNERASTDKSVHGWRSLIRREPEITKARLDAIIKNTYRTLMTRGQKGCYVYFLDDETRKYFESRLQGTTDSDKILTPTSLTEKLPKNNVLPFRRMPLAEVKPFKNCVPLYDLKAAAGQFSDEQQGNGLDLQNMGVDFEGIDWIELPDVFRPHPGLFVAQVIGESMNRRIPNGSWCLFRLKPVGSRQNKVVLVQHREIADTETGGHYTVKVYESKKKESIDGSWHHESIILKPDTSAPGYEPIILSEEQSDELKVIAELIAVLG
jgi:uncharacterized protein